jgi:hypothetical protein
VKPSFFAPLVFVSLLNLAHATEPKYQWLVHGSADQTWGLSYAHPDSDVGLLWIWCNPATGETTINPAITTSGIKEGERGTIILSTSTKKLRIEGEASSNEASEGIEVSALLPQPQELAALFEKLGSLKVAVPGNQTTLPINREAKSAFAEFRTQCRF